MRMDMLRGPDAGTLLVRALRAAAAGAGVTMRIDSIAGRPWASATFTGMRHVITFTAWDVPALRQWIDALPESEFRLPGHIVADLGIDRIERAGAETRVTLAVLTLVEG